MTLQLLFTIAIVLLCKSAAAVTTQVVTPSWNWWALLFSVVFPTIVILIAVIVHCASKKMALDQATASSIEVEDFEDEDDDMMQVGDMKNILIEV